MEREANRRVFMLGGSALLATAGVGLGLKALTMPEIGVEAPTMPVEPDVAIEPTPDIPTHNRGTLVITQETRVGEPYMDYLETVYKRFEPFKPYGHVVIGKPDKVKDGTITVSQESLEEDPEVNLPFLFSKSLVKRGLEDGTDHRVLRSYATFLSFVETNIDPKTLATKKTYELFNAYPDRGTEYLEDELDLFASVSTTLYRKSDGIKEAVLAMPTYMVTESDYGSSVEKDSPQRDLSKRLIQNTLNIYTSLLPVDIGNISQDKLLDALFIKIGLLRYELLR